jgi:hypothetical protein
MKKIELLRSARYFWKNDGRLDGFSGFDLVEANFPEVFRAWCDYLRASSRISDQLYKVQVGEDEECIQPGKLDPVTVDLCKRIGRMVDIIKDNHQDNCPTNWGEPCDCWVKDALKAAGQ